jgi:hypothetical protein
MLPWRSLAKLPYFCAIFFRVLVAVVPESSAQAWRCNRRTGHRTICTQSIKRAQVTMYTWTFSPCLCLINVEPSKWPKSCECQLGFPDASKTQALHQIRVPYQKADWTIRDLTLNFQIRLDTIIQQLMWCIYYTVTYTPNCINFGFSNKHKHLN